MRLTRIRLALLSSMATACCCLTVNDAMESELSRTSNDPRVPIEKHDHNLIIAPSPSTGRRLEELTPTIQPTTTWRPTTTWYPTTTPYPTVRPTLKQQQQELDYKPYENTGYHEPRLVQPTTMDASPFASKQTSTTTTTEQTSSSSSSSSSSSNSSNNSHTPSRHGDGNTPARAVDDDDTASVTTASTRTVQQPASSGGGGFGLGVGLLLAVFVAAGLLSHHNTRQRNQQLPTSGLELFDVPQRSSRMGFGGGYSDVPEADIRGPNRDYNI
ncbi:hypothetical protein MPSEU_000182700 [Mayamaea pseudoterrestris]|nr:hypothetical protein MPSEU_000182700 [Mayamaea pseudoterrestris]